MSKRAVYSTARHQASAGVRERLQSGTGARKWNDDAVMVDRSSPTLQRLAVVFAAIDAAARVKIKQEAQP
jgi:hypothetical protein